MVLTVLLCLLKKGISREGDAMTDFCPVFSVSEALTLDFRVLCPSWPSPETGDSIADFTGVTEVVGLFCYAYPGVLSV